MKRQEVLSSHTVIAPAISVQRKLSAPPHRLPLATIVFGYLESHLKASLHCIQCAATGTAAIWILSSCPVRERENYLVVAEKRGQKEKKQRKRKSQKSFFCGTLWRTDLGMRVVKAFCLAYSFLVWQLISPTAQKHLTGLAEVNSSFICPSCSWSGEWQNCFSSVWTLLSFLFPLSCAVVWSLGKLVSFLPTAFSPGSGQHPSALAPAPYSCKLPLLKPFAPDQAAGCWGLSGFASTPFPVIFSLLLLQLARLFAALRASTFCFPSTLPFYPLSSPCVLAAAGLLSGSFWDTASLLYSMSCPQNCWISLSWGQRCILCVPLI